MKVSRTLNEDGERLRRSEAPIALSAGGVAFWESFASLSIPVGVAVVVASSSLGFTFVATGNLGLTEAFGYYGGLLIVLFSVITTWVVFWARQQKARAAVREIHGLRAAHQLELGLLNSRDRRRIRERRDSEDGFAFDSHPK